MRRGLMAWDSDEIPLGALRNRVERYQAEMRKSGEDAAILYTNFIRSAAVSHLTAFSPYWADGILLVPGSGEPLFATTLSKRVGSWIQTVKPVGELVNSPTPGKVVGQRLADEGVRRVAILERDAFPAGLYDDLVSALPDVDIVDGSATFAAARSHIDAVESRLLTRADHIAREALERVDSGAATDVGAAVGAVEKHARLRGAEEIYVAIAPDLDEDRRFLRLSGARPLGSRFAIRSTLAYKGAWVRRTRSYARDEKGRRAMARAETWFDSMLPKTDGARPVQEQIVAMIAPLDGTRLNGWIAEAPVGTRPLAVVESDTQPRETSNRAPAVVVTVRLTIDGVPWCGAGRAGPACESSP